ncbi:MAG TPA: FdhF/YdeP family oxidoreductase [Thermomicrobiales bacterium]|nr:FdhF/YdeP family oxidoreductase [Thermomicrobiales bacterium]
MSTTNQPLRRPRTSPEVLRGQGTSQDPAAGCGPATHQAPGHRDYHHPAAGWGATISVAETILHQRAMREAPGIMFRMNHHVQGWDCPGCAWPDDQHVHLDICENGIKHAAWEMTAKRVGREFFAHHSVTELMGWSDFALEDAGRLTEPMVYDAATDHYVPINWPDAFSFVGETLRGLESPNQASFYTSGRLGNEASFLYQWFVREYGTNNFPDCANMCHEASGIALRTAIGTNKGTVDLEDWQQADAIFLIGVNAASNAPRMLTYLAEAQKRGAALIHINPIVEAAATRTIVPHDFGAMARFRATETSTLNIQPRIGGDAALIRGVAKTLLESARDDPGAIDQAFLDEFTTGFEEYRATCEGEDWADLTDQSGVSEAEIRKIAAIYRQSQATIVAWCLGISQQEHGVATVREIVNLLLLRGNIGRPGAGPCPIRGHSNVQGNRTQGINHHPPDALLDRIATACQITPPRDPGLDVVGTIFGMHRGDVKVFVGMGGNFAIATPDTSYTFEALRRCDLTVQVSTKLNRSHLVHGRQALILPCVARSEKDYQADGVQSGTVEDSMSMVHLSKGRKEPASAHLRSEPAIIAGIAMATLPETTTPWTDLVADYDWIRDRMAIALDGFEDMNRKVRQPGGFRIRQPARERVFVTGSGRAEFSHGTLHDAIPTDGRLMLSTMRSHDQFNTTIYSNDDRYRGVKNLRTLLFMNAGDMIDRGIAEFARIDITSIASDGTRRSVYGYQAVGYDIPRGCAMGYMPELNVLCPIVDYSDASRQPVMKHLPIEVTLARAVRTAAPGNA